MALSGDPPEHINVNKFGWLTAVASIDQTVWTAGSQYTFPGSAVALTATSNVHAVDVGGVNSLGAGARAVEISGLDSGWLMIDEVVVLDGTSGTNPTSNQFLRINRVQVVSSGVNAKNGGNIYVGVGALTAGLPATVIAQVDSGYGQTQQAFYSIPNSYQGELHNFEASTGKGGVLETLLWAREDGNGRNLKIRESIVNNSIEKQPHQPLIFPPKTDLEATASLVSGAASNIAVTMDIDLHYIGSKRPEED
jgi:hypothetical protein